jgi:hypothetical protein
MALGLACGLASSVLAGSASAAPAAGQQVPLVFETTAGDRKISYNYWLYLP